jgi:hypothetical protein
MPNEYFMFASVTVAETSGTLDLTREDTPKAMGIKIISIVKDSLHTRRLPLLCAISIQNPPEDY